MAVKKPFLESTEKQRLTLLVLEVVIWLQGYFVNPWEHGGVALFLLVLWLLIASVWLVCFSYHMNTMRWRTTDDFCDNTNKR